MKFAYKGKIFKDRKEAGKELAGKLSEYKGKENILILALPRGGVPVAFEVAESLGADLDVFITRKLRFPGEPELAVGALAENGEIFLNKDINQGLFGMDFAKTRDREVKIVLKTLRLKII